MPQSAKSAGNGLTPSGVLRKEIENTHTKARSVHLHGLGRRLTWTALRGVACTQAQIPAKGAIIPTQDQSAILEGSLWRAVPRFALPVAATSILE